MSEPTNSITYVAKPLYQDPFDYIALILGIINFTVTIILLVIILATKVKIMTRAKLIQLTQLVIISLLWQGLQYWSYFLNGHPYTRWTFTLLGLILPFLTVIFQTEILLIFTLIPVHKDRIKIFQKVFTFLYVICFIIMLLRAYYYVTITPAWLMMIYYGTYLPFVIISFLYENFHAFKVSTSLFYVAKSFAEVSNLNPEIWKSQYRTYKQLFLLIAVNLFLQWIAVGFWVIGFTSDESLVFPNLMIIGLTGGSSHIIFVILFYYQMNKVPLEKHKGSNQGRTFVTGVKVSTVKD